MHVRIGVVPVDFSKGKMTVRYLADVDDKTFDAILAEAEAKER